MHRRSDSRVAAFFRRVLAVALAGAGVVLVLALVRVGAPPRIDVSSTSSAIGKTTPISVRVEGAGRGIEDVRVDLIQGDSATPVAHQAFAPRPFWAFWGPRTASLDLPLRVGRETAPSLKSGEATIRVTATRPGTWLRHPRPVVKELRLPVRLTPPSVQLASSKHYVAQGGCEAVVYRVGETAIRDGVRVGEWFFAGRALPGGGKQDRFALFAVPYDHPNADGVRLVASDDAGNESTISFVDQFFPRPMRTDSIQLTDAFLGKVVPEIVSQTTGFADKGDPLANYLEINGALRRANNADLKQLAERSQAAFLWREPFSPLPGGKVMSHFADRRTYVYQGKNVDQQDHLGFDLASTEKAVVPAANRGRVVLARYFGIYGNTVVLDHGYGLLSLYAHLSSIDVQEGKDVERGAPLGRSGQTGLAGGDHLHYTMVLDGLPVTPVEWWDPHWLNDRLAKKLGGALPFQGKKSGGRT